MILELEKTPCVSCGTCTSKCGLGLETASLMTLYNEYVDAGSDADGCGTDGCGTGSTREAVLEKLKAIPEDKGPKRCFGCGACEFFCPEKVEIWKTMGKLMNLLEE